MYTELCYVLSGRLSSIVLKDKRNCLAYLKEIEKVYRNKTLDDWWTTELNEIPF